MGGREERMLQYKRTETLFAPHFLTVTSIKVGKRTGLDYGQNRWELGGVGGGKKREDQADRGVQQGGLIIRQPKRSVL
jgi:hypothetical protein